LAGGCGQGQDSNRLGDKEKARWRGQALDWLRADLKAYRQVVEKSAGKGAPAVARTMRDWLGDENFAGVRGPEALPRLPEAERRDWQQLWQEVDALRQRATAPPKKAEAAFPEKSPPGRRSGSEVHPP
jgi:hypothetical protein